MQLMPWNCESNPITMQSIQFLHIESIDCHPFRIRNSYHILSVCFLFAHVCCSRSPTVSALSIKKLNKFTSSHVTWKKKKLTLALIFFHGLQYFCYSSSEKRVSFHTSNPIRVLDRHTIRFCYLFHDKVSRSSSKMYRVQKLRFMHSNSRAFCFVVSCCCSLLLLFLLFPKFHQKRA